MVLIPGIATLLPDDDCWIARIATILELDNNLFLANVYIYAHVAITHDIYIQINMHTTMLYL